jgi:hypothetical protein
MTAAAGPLYALDSRAPFVAMTVVNCASVVSLYALPWVAAHRAADAFSPRRAVVAVQAFAPWLALPAFVFMRPAGSLVRAVRSGYLNDHVESTGRATVLSASRLLFSVVRFPMLLGAGVVADAFSPYVALSAVSGAFLLCTGVLWLVEAPIREGQAGQVPAASD